MSTPQAFLRKAHFGYWLSHQYSASRVLLPSPHPVPGQSTPLSVPALPRISPELQLQSPPSPTNPRLLQTPIISHLVCYNSFMVLSLSSLVFNSPFLQSSQGPLVRNHKSYHFPALNPTALPLTLAEKSDSL